MQSVNYISIRCVLKRDLHFLSSGYLFSHFYLDLLFCCRFYGPPASLWILGPTVFLQCGALSWQRCIGFFVLKVVTGSSVCHPLSDLISGSSHSPLKVQKLSQFHLLFSNWRIIVSREYLLLGLANFPVYIQVFSLPAYVLEIMKIPCHLILS